MFKRDFLKKLGMLSAWTALGLAASSKAARAMDKQGDPLTGLWEMTVLAQGATYRYMYSISNGAWVATGNIDDSFQGFKYSPTMGSYIAQSAGGYRYVEKGWVFNMKGTNVGTFGSKGSFALASDQSSFSGPGIFTQYDLHGKVVFQEHFTAHAARAAV